MTVGDGIFWAAIILGSVALFLGTKDRWSWKKIAKRSVLSIVIVAGLGVGAFYANDWYSKRPQVVQEYWGIKLGAAKSDVLFTKGEPTRRRSDDRWEYTPSDKFEVLVEFSNDKVSAVLALGDRTYLPDIGNISSYVSMDDLVERCGTPSAITHSEHGLTRIVNYKAFNVVAVFKQSELIGGGIDSDLTKPRRFGQQSEPAASGPVKR